MPRGKLVREGRQLKLKYTRDYGKEMVLPVSYHDVRNDVIGLLDGGATEVDVEYEHPKGQGPKMIHPAPPSSDFVNSYNFVPAVPRDKLPKGSELADRLPIGHDRLRPGYFTGKLRVSLTVKTPLLIPDAARARDDGHGHNTFPLRVGPDGKPYLAPTAVKGMLRAAYEAVTNSRLGIFPASKPGCGPASGHAVPLAFRLRAQEGLKAVPARIVQVGNRLVAQLHTGTSRIGPRGEPMPGDRMYAAWVKWYGFDENNRPDERPTTLRHGLQVWAYITPWDHDGPPKPFRFWNVEELLPGDQPEPNRPSERHRQPWFKAWPDSPALDRPRWVRGWLCVTGRNINNKHDERVYFTADGPSQEIAVDHLRASWEQLITNYQDEHRQELANGVTHPPALAEHTWFSRHITHDLQTPAADERQLANGTLCYAVVESSGDQVTGIRALYPVMISRKLFDCSPLESLHGTLRPATALTELSPADRVFGWVSQDGANNTGSVGHRGQLRVGPVQCQTERDKAIRKFSEPGLPLAILGQPKPAQARFYLGDPTGRAQANGQDKQRAGYDGTKQLRGRKVYPHHEKVAADHWNPPADVTGLAREYARHPQAPKLRDTQNRSILGWVEPGTVFAFDLQVTNLSDVELGALVWLLNLPADHYHRLGLGKPLGFGSVRLEIEANGTTVHDADGWKTIHATLDEATPSPEDLGAMSAHFEAELRKAYPTAADDILKAVKVAARGVVGKPVHYPRTDKAPDPRGEGYNWFVENDGGKRLTLPDLTADDPGLPFQSR